LIGIDWVDGGLRWTQPISKTMVDATIDTSRSTLYVSNYFGQIQAFHPPDPQDGSELSSAPIWNIKLDGAGGATLMPLPGGGVAASFRQQLYGISSAGVVLWELDAGVRVFDWILGDDQLIFSMLGEDDSTWTVGAGEPKALAAQISGHLAIVGDQVWVYGEDGIYRLNPETRSSELLYALPRATLRLGDMVALPDGGVLVVHVDPFDKRLIALNAEGTLRWQLSFSHFARYQQKLLVLNGRAYLVSYNSSHSLSEVSIYAIDLNSAKLIRIFTGGSRYPLPGETWAFPVGENSLLINIAGGNMAVLDLRTAIEAVTQAAKSH
jgi:hypothetical protein